MNNIVKRICFLLLLGMSTIFAFESQFTLPVNFYNNIEDPINAYDLNNNPASKIYEENTEVFSINTIFADLGYKRTYDPLATQTYRADFTTLRRINERSFFSASITYDEYRQQDLFSSMEKDFYDDYFSMIDSTLGNTKYYGPKLAIMYNIQLADHLFLGVEGNYGIERSLKDTFPKTITIMRNSEYHIGLDYRKKSMSIGVHGRYYDDQKYYEAVRSYSDVQTKTYIGYNVFFNEASSSTIKKRRIRNGLEYGGHFRIGGRQAFSMNFSASGLRRSSKADLLRSSSTRERGFWLREGIHLLGSIDIHPESSIASRIYSEYLYYNDWGKSMISQTLILENMESYFQAGVVLAYQPSMIQKAFVGAEIGKVAYDYKEYVFPFEDSQTGTEWKLYAGAELYLSSKTRLNFNLEYAKENPKFYWNTDYFLNTGLRINLEQLFSFGYIEVKFENINRKPSNDSKSISVMQIGLSYRRK